MNKLEDAAFQSAGRTFIIEDSSRILGDAQECHAGAVFFLQKSLAKTNTKRTGMRNMTWYSMCDYCLYSIYIYIYINIFSQSHVYI